MTPKEAFKEYKQVAQWLVDGEFDNYSPYIKLGKDLLEIAPTIEQSLTELERLKKFKETFDNYELAKKQDFIAYENWLECERELGELKSWQNELSETISDLIDKTKYWEEKENKTDFEKGIARGYKTMLHHLLTGIDFDEGLEKPPTVEEVCEALSEQLKSTIVLRKNKHGFTFNYAGTGKTIISLNYNLLNIKAQLPPHLITLIGRFYEGLEVKE